MTAPLQLMEGSSRVAVWQRWGDPDTVEDLITCLRSGVNSVIGELGLKGGYDLEGWIMLSPEDLTHLLVYFAVAPAEPVVTTLVPQVPTAFLFKGFEVTAHPVRQGYYMVVGRLWE